MVWYISLHLALVMLLGGKCVETQFFTFFCHFASIFLCDHPFCVAHVALYIKTTKLISPRLSLLCKIFYFQMFLVPAKKFSFFPFNMVSCQHLVRYNQTVTAASPSDHTLYAHVQAAIRASTHGNSSQPQPCLQCTLGERVSRSTIKLPFHPLIMYSVNASIHTAYQAYILCTKWKGTDYSVRSDIGCANVGCYWTSQDHVNQFS